MKNITQIFAVSAFSIFSLFSCTKPGCTDKNAINYNAEANEDDRTCTYRGDITFWCLPAVSESLITSLHDTLYFELEGELVDSIPTAFFFSPTGECNTPGVKTIPREEMPYDYRHYRYRVKGDNYLTLWDGFIKLDANDCAQIQLE